MKTIEISELIEMYHDFLNKNGCVKVGNLQYLPSMILKQIDSAAYVAGFEDYYEFIKDKYYCEDMETKKWKK